MTLKSERNSSKPVDESNCQSTVARSSSADVPSRSAEVIPATSAGCVPSKPEPESFRALMREAWMDHHHTREQSWKTVHMAIILFAAMVAIGFNPALQNMRVLSLCAGVSVCLVAAMGACIAWHHRAVEHGKRNTITQCQDALGLSEYVPVMQRRWRGRTSLFIMGIHVLLCMLAILYLCAR
jgi:hypothetical protein